MSRRGIRISVATNAKHLHRPKRGRAFAAWLGLWLLLWQTAAASGLVERPMGPEEMAGGALAICTEHGMQALPGDGAPGHAPTDHSAPACPCCLPFSPGGGGAILASAILLSLPAWSDAPIRVALASVSLPRPASTAPQQPRAPPFAI
jgi:hypothetical protein